MKRSIERLTDYFGNYLETSNVSEYSYSRFSVGRSARGHSLCSRLRWLIILGERH
jgi:hypothetical protein